MKHKLGIVGYGGVASWHYDKIQKIHDLEVAAVCDIDPERVKLAVSQGMKGYADIDVFLQDDSFDMVLISVPNNFHKTLVLKALRAGKNVMCEKPVGMTVAELDAMTACAAETGKVFTVHQNRRWDNDFRIVMEAYKSGVLGKTYAIESRVHGQNGFLHGWRDAKVAGGGMVFDWGVHLIDQLLYMLDEKIVQIDAHLHQVLTTEVDDYFKLLMRTESGLSLQVEVGTYCMEPQPRWYVYGDKAALLIKDWECNGHIIRASQYEMKWEPVVVQTAAGPTRTMAPRPSETMETLPLEIVPYNSFDIIYTNLMRVIDGTEQLLIEPAQARRVLQVIEAAFESQEKHTSITCCI